MATNETMTLIKAETYTTEGYEARYYPGDNTLCITQYVEYGKSRNVGFDAHGIEFLKEVFREARI